MVNMNMFLDVTSLNNNCRHIREISIQHGYPFPIRMNELACVYTILVWSSDLFIFKNISQIPLVLLLFEIISNKNDQLNHIHSVYKVYN